MKEVPTLLSETMYTAKKYWENVNPIGIRSCYDEGKRIAEMLFFDYHRQNDVDIKVIRIFNTYGTNMNTHDGRVVSNYIVQTLLGAGSRILQFMVMECRPKASVM